MLFHFVAADGNIAAKTLSALGFMAKPLATDTLYIGESCQNSGRTPKHEFPYKL